MYYLTPLLVAVLCGLHVLAQATTTTLSYDNNYGNPNLSLNDVACSTGTNGLETKGYTTLGSLPNFPNVGGVYTVSGYNSPNCGACYAVTYQNTTINILAVDKTTTGFTVSPQAMNTLTGGQAVQLGRVDVSFVPALASACGFS